MDLVSIILTFIGAYGLFMFIAYVLARLFFPIVEMDELDELEGKTKHARDRQSKRMVTTTTSRLAR